MHYWVVSNTSTYPSSSKSKVGNFTQGILVQTTTNTITTCQLYNVMSNLTHNRRSRWWSSSIIILVYWAVLWWAPSVGKWCGPCGQYASYGHGKQVSWRVEQNWLASLSVEPFNPWFMLYQRGYKSCPWCGELHGRGMMGLHTIFFVVLPLLIPVMPMRIILSIITMM